MKQEGRQKSESDYYGIANHAEPSSAPVTQPHWSDSRNEEMIITNAITTAVSRVVFK